MGSTSRRCQEPVSRNSLLVISLSCRSFAPIANCISEEEVVSRPLYCKQEQGHQPDAHPEIDTWLADETTNHSATLPPLGQVRVIFYGGTTRYSLAIFHQVYHKKLSRGSLFAQHTSTSTVLIAYYQCYSIPPISLGDRYI